MFIDEETREVKILDTVIPGDTRVKWRNMSC